MKARFVKPHTRERCVVRASTIDVFAAIKPEIQNLGMTEVGVIGFLKHYCSGGESHHVRRNKDILILAALLVLPLPHGLWLPIICLTIEVRDGVR